MTTPDIVGASNMVIGLWILVAFLLLGSGVYLAAKLLAFYSERSSEPVLFSEGLVVMASGLLLIEVTFALFLGTFGWFNLPAELVLHAAITVLAWRFLPILSGLPVGLGKLRTLVRSFSRREIVIIGIIVVTMMCLGWEQVLFPTTNYDSLTYHLPAMVTWVQSGSTLANVRPVDQTPFYPFDWELLSAVGFLPFHQDLALGWANLIAWGLLLLSAYTVMRQLEVRRDVALAISLIASSTPAVLSKLNSAEVELGLAAIFAVVMCLLSSFLVRGRLRAPMLALPFLGLLCGIKFTGLPYAAVFAVIILILVCYPRLRGKAGRSFDGWTWRGGLCFAMWFAVIAGYWYVRNWILFDNPFGSIEIRIAGVVIFPGTSFHMDQLAGTSLAACFSPLNLNHWKVLSEQLVLQFGMPILVLLPLSLFGLFFFRKANRAGSVVLFVNFTLVLVIAVLYCFTPVTAKVSPDSPAMTSWIGLAFRYGFPVLGPLAVLAGWGASRLKSFSWLWIVTGIVAVFSAFFIVVLLPTQTNSELLLGLRYRDLLHLNATQWLSLALNLGLLLAIFLASWLAICAVTWGIYLALRTSRRAVVYLGLLMSLTVTICLGGFGVYLRELNRRAVYGEAAYQLETSSPPASQLAYAFGNRIYPWYGSDWHIKLVEFESSLLIDGKLAAAMRAKGLTELVVGYPETEANSKQRQVTSVVEAIRNGNSLDFQPLSVPEISNSPEEKNLEGSLIGLIH